MRSFGLVIGRCSGTWSAPSAASDRLFTAPRGVAQLGSALRSGRRGRRFKSCHPDKCHGEASRIERRLIPDIPPGKRRHGPARSGFRPVLPVRRLPQPLWHRRRTVRPLPLRLDRTSVGKSEVTSREPPSNRATQRRPPAPALRITSAVPIARIVESLEQASGHLWSVTRGCNDSPRTAQTGRAAVGTRQPGSCRRARGGSQCAVQRHFRSNRDQASTSQS